MAPLTFPCCRHCNGVIGDTCVWVRDKGKPHQMPCDVCDREKAAAKRHGTESSKSRHPSQKGKTT